MGSDRLMGLLSSGMTRSYAGQPGLSSASRPISLRPQSHRSTARRTRVSPGIYVRPLEATTQGDGVAVLNR
jgi:hypothetical protein